ncbi:hypothetical protein, variant [Aphanomyces invadans]|nr:hypothetical protein, variant [Aphanomyces invadans]ETW09427.1 hypothetical protein, variant [Aphanomyces invadans]|eukprot:XP_008860838.1 hypothetical protein, variant [Aphanomyces invadans]
MRDGVVMCQLCGFCTVLDVDLRAFLFSPPLPFEAAMRNEVSAVHDQRQHASQASAIVEEEPLQPDSKRQKVIDDDSPRSLEGVWTSARLPLTEKALPFTSSSLGMLKLLQGPNFAQHEVDALSDTLLQFLHHRHILVKLQDELHDLEQLHRHFSLRQKTVSAFVVECTALQIRRLRATFDRVATPYCRVVGIATHHLRELLREAREIGHAAVDTKTTPSTSDAMTSTSLRSRRRKNFQERQGTVAAALLTPPKARPHPSDLLLTEKIQLWWRVAHSVATVCAGRPRHSIV